jgi:peptide methionine sulfoxide reductase MsrA
VFWSIHNPTTKNRQGPDIGSVLVAYHTADTIFILNISASPMVKKAKLLCCESTSSDVQKPKEKF